MKANHSPELCTKLFETNLQSHDDWPAAAQEWQLHDWKLQDYKIK